MKKGIAAVRQSLFFLYPKRLVEMGKDVSHLVFLGF